MKLDLLYEFDCAAPWIGPHPHGQKDREQRAYREGIDQIRHADKLGYNTAWIVEHHFREGRSHLPCSEAILGALSQVTENIRLGFGVTLAPFAFIHPARIAEKVATVDILSGGRVEWGVGRSTPMEQRAFVVNPKTALAESLEAMEIVTGMWREKYFEWDSPTFKFPKRMVTPKPFQDPHPPAWMATASHGTARIAASRGLGLLAFAVNQPLEELKALFDAYRGSVSTDNPVTGRCNDRIAAYTIVHCAESEEQAIENGAWDNVNWWYRNIAEVTLKWEMEGATKEEAIKAFPTLKAALSGNVPIDEYKKSDTIIVGDPEAVFNKMKKYADIGVDQLLCYMQFGNMPSEKIKRSMDLIAHEVMPELKKYKVKRQEAMNARA
jgi:alkanesulfonate monooxygenase SsuD/methylene tetrahydromethanopterin reductase-like flavin-dependent oxidoreductase (luciferase family)